MGTARAPDMGRRCLGPAAPRSRRSPTCWLRAKAGRPIPSTLLRCSVAGFGPTRRALRVRSVRHILKASCDAWSRAALARRRIRARHAFMECPTQEDRSGSRREDLKLSKAAFVGEMSQGGSGVGVKVSHLLLAGCRDVSYGSDSESLRTSISCPQWHRERTLPARPVAGE